ncbi:hypothetical protein [Bartonella sp. CB60]|uniref:hypothetical protein n=1 Tax=Bartonella sp. CB60 TaxID=3113619 RepID=UPI00300DED27
MDNTTDQIHDESTLPLIIETTLKNTLKEHANVLEVLKVATDYHNTQQKHYSYATFINSLNKLKSELPEFTKELDPQFTKEQGYHYLKDGVLKKVMPLISKHGFFVYNPLFQHSKDEITLETTLMHDKSGHSISSRGTYSTIIQMVNGTYPDIDTKTYQFIQEYAFECNLCSLLGM